MGPQRDLMKGRMWITIGRLGPIWIGPWGCYGYVGFGLGVMLFLQLMFAGPHGLPTTTSPAAAWASPPTRCKFPISQNTCALNERRGGGDLGHAAEPRFHILLPPPPGG
eukprot:704245-Pyramimonas_sp.AAC.1